MIAIPASGPQTGLMGILEPLHSATGCANPPNRPRESLRYAAVAAVRSRRLAAGAHRTSRRLAKLQPAARGSQPKRDHLLPAIGPDRTTVSQGDAISGHDE